MDNDYNRKAAKRFLFTEGKCKRHTISKGMGLNRSANSGVFKSGKLLVLSDDIVSSDQKI